MAKIKARKLRTKVFLFSLEIKIIINSILAIECRIWPMYNPFLV